MPHAISILLYGRDLTLLRIRKLDLETANLDVRITASGERVREELDSGKVNLLLLCQTLPRIEANYLVRIARCTWPSAKVLAIQGGRHGCSECLPSQMIDVFDGPEKLLEKIDMLFRQKTTRVLEDIGVPRV